MAINSPKLRGSAPKRIPIKDMTLEQLYESPKITPGVKNAILLKEDFSEIQPRYCDLVCKLPCQIKKPILAGLDTEEVDVILIQDHRSGDNGWKTAQQENDLYGRQIYQLSKLAFGNDVTFKVLDLTKCYHDSSPKLTQTQKMSCAPYLWEEIRKSNPKVIVSLSTDVTKALGLKKSNYDNRGEFHWSDREGINVPVVLTLHVKVLNMLRQNASGKMYGPDFTSVILNDLAKVRLILDNRVEIGGLHERVEKIVADQVFVCSSLQDVKETMDVLLKLPPNQVIAWDLETTGLDPWAEDARILTSQFGYRRADGKVQAFVVPLWHREQKFYDANEAWKYVEAVLLSERAKVGHNVKFDVLYCTVTTGVRPRGRIFDSMLMLHSLNSGIKGNYGLKQAQWDHLPMLGLGGYDDLLDETLDAEEIKRLVKLEKGDVDEETESEE